MQKKRFIHMASKILFNVLFETGLYRLKTKQTRSINVHSLFMPICLLKMISIPENLVVSSRIMLLEMMKVSVLFIIKVAMLSITYVPVADASNLKMCINLLLSQLIRTHIS